MTKEIEAPQVESKTTGILIANLGTPDAPTPVAVSAFLREFLLDPRVIDYPRWLWWPILHAIILPLRSRQLAQAYRKIWTKVGSPLRVISEQQAVGLQKLLMEDYQRPVIVSLGMRYGSPSIADALERLRAARVEQLLILPLYPQYSATTTASVFDAVAAGLKSWGYIPKLRMISQYADDPGYIAALATSIRQYWEKEGRGEHLLFSFHGLPKRYLLKGDPYYYLCHKTANLTAIALGLSDEEWSVAFQSRVGREEWLQPYCDVVLQGMPKQGIKEVDVVCPGFAADCLETLEEIAIRNKALFLQAGGEKLQYISALNDGAHHLEALASIVTKNMD